MYRTLFDIAGIAMLGWLLLVLLPGWKVTRRIAESAIFPLFLCVLYVAGLAAVLRELGPGFMRDFGSADGVLALLRIESIALVAWIHILAFDQLVGVLIYRDNMKHRFVPLPVQSVLLVATLMLGPVGFLSYWAVRVARTRRPLAWGEPAAASRHEPFAAGEVAAGEVSAGQVSAGRPSAEQRPADGLPSGSKSATVVVPRFRAVATGASLSAVLIGLWRREPVVAWLGVLGFVLAAITAVIAAVNGGWLLGAEGRLLEAVKFDVALGIYILTLGLILPLAPFTERGRRRWVAWLVGLGVFSYAMETVQSWRGLDPRFSAIAGPVDQALGGVFFLAALGILTLFVILITRFLRPDALPDHPPLRLALLYAAGGALIAFGVGIIMSVIAGRSVGAGGDLMAIHAAGFHALQAVPLVALLLGSAALPMARAEWWTHVAGSGWLVLCVGMVMQALGGNPLLAVTPAFATMLLGALAWTTAAGYAARARVWTATVPIR